ncbi:hypothetical protein LNAOJCKE_0444 [Methylorubrum aminovorans]|uniref:DNA-binding protein n=1 Tax=Methylorubrum aminovorans TaxID=269069 RepID=A0ABQ4U733_9HYPH|nr:hypothetical protein [Methylorubrum aminovorans]GJE63250.1 hypothetical protein LNAOJCKE_0444 [Methylorubrum aminovorans]GMA79302.1 hypothetical protein GCM10025880_57190 [Methylorubrum aminovorans]
MARFTMEQMLDELRTIFLYEADHIAMGAGEEAAERFLGFPLREEEGEHEFCDLDPARVDLGRFQISKTFERAYGFVFEPGLTNALDEEVQDLLVFMQGTPRVGGRAGSAGVTHSFMGPDGLCQTIADAAYARWKLEIVERGEFTTRELALLANMSEGAVRNAMADKDEGGLRAIPGSKPVQVEFEEAKRWLAGRRGFKPTPVRLRDDPNLRSRFGSVQTAEELGELIQRLRVQFEPILSSSLKAWSAAEIASWEIGSFAFDAERAAELATGLDVDVPLFVGKALEVSLRRDAKPEVRS